MNFCDNYIIMNLHDIKLSKSVFPVLYYLNYYIITLNQNEMIIKVNVLQLI